VIKTFYRTGSLQTELAMPKVSQMGNKHLHKCSKIGRMQFQPTTLNQVVLVVIFYRNDSKSLHGAGCSKLG
jgi:hypothetical protein